MLINRGGLKQRKCPDPLSKLSQCNGQPPHHPLFPPIKADDCLSMHAAGLTNIAKSSRHLCDLDSRVVKADKEER